MSRPYFIFLLNSCQRRVQQWIAAQQQDGFQLSPAQAAVLFVLEREDGVLMGRLAQQLDLVPSAISGLVERMQKAALVQRQPCAADGRAHRVWLTEQGRATLPSLHQKTDQAQRKLCDGFTQEELRTVERWLQHVQQEFDQ